MSAIFSVMGINHVKKGIAMKQKFTRCAGPVGEGKHKWARAPVRATNYPEKSFIRRILITANLALFLSLAAAPVMSADGIDAEADTILRSMTTYIGGLPSISVRADVDNEIVDLAGRKLQLSSSTEIIIARPSKLHVSRQGPFADTRLVFDGKVLTLYGKDLNVYAQIESPGTIEDAIETIRSETGLDAPGADLFYADPYPGLTSGVTSGAYLGTAYVNGLECHHLAFRADKVDWQLWVQVGDTPLPMKYIITTKWMTGAPQYAVRFRDWNVKPRIENSRFEFSLPEGARKIEKIPANEMGEFILKGNQ